MQFIAARDEILKELSLVQGIVERKNTIPILANVLMDARGSRVELTATDLDVGVRTSFKASVREEGALTLSAKKVFEIVRASSSEEIQFKELENYWASITCGKSYFKMVGLSRAEFPSLPDPPAEPSCSLPAVRLRDMIQKTIFAITGEEGRYYLNGALLDIQQDSFALVSTDGHRLAYISTKDGIGERGGSSQRIIVPKKTLSELLKIITEPDTKIAFSVADNHLFFQIGDRLLVSKRIENQFPAWEKVIPRENDKVVGIGREDFSGALRRVSLLSNERSRAVRLGIRSGKMEVSSQNPEVGEAREEIEVEYTGEPVQIGFNGQYLLDFMTAVGDEKVKLELKDDQSQGLLRGTAQKEPAEDYCYVVMPMRI